MTTTASHSCPRVRYLVKLAQARAHRARVAYLRWSYDWEWRRWLPAKWYRIGMCETHLTWAWNSGTYQGAFGFYWGTWDAYKPGGFPAEAYQATPRQQMIVAERVRAAVGYGAWGCGGA